MKHSGESKPNIVLILADDLGYGDLGCYGATKVSTPQIDRIAREGVRFTDAHSPSSVCTPSRYNLLTGRYGWRTYAKTGCVWANDPLLIEPDQETIASLLRRMGYCTGLVGKWHLGFGRPGCSNWDDLLGVNYNEDIRPGPREVGFDYFFGMPAVGQHPNVFIEDHRMVGFDLDDPIELHFDPRAEFMTDYLKRPRTYNIDLAVSGGRDAHYDFEEAAITLTRRAVDFIEDNRNRPFFLLFAERNIHAPIRPNPRFLGTSACGIYGDFIHELDWSVGEILGTLDRLDLSERTLVVFTSDNGAVSEGHKPASFVEHQGHMANGRLRGQKTEVWEGGHRIPFIARWPEMIRPESSSHEMIALTDMLPSFTALFGHELPGDTGPDGFNVLPAILGQKTNKPLREFLIHDSWKGLYAIRLGPWKLILGRGGGGIGWTEDGETRGSPVQLYNLDRDLIEENDLSDRHPEIVSELTRRLEMVMAADRTP